MIEYDLNDTIAAIATSTGESGIGIVRISGKEALAIADRIFVSKDKKAPSTFKTYTTHYGWIIRGAKIIDEVILTVMRSPRSYTKEDIVEINCHGGIVALRAVLDLVLEQGCRIACPGEFTKRAFLNGRIDLAQAEAVLDIIRSKTESALRIGTGQLKGNLSAEVDNLRESLLDILSQIEANIDFPDEETGAVDLGNIAQKLRAVKRMLKTVLETSWQGRVLREGINAVICGKPNVGKSSLLNALLKQERAIVTPIAGTTRDTIEEIIDIRGIPVKIVDTAGIIEPKDLIERKAIQRSKKYIASADLVILLFDGSKRIAREDIALMEKLKKKPAIAIINKIDLKQKIERARILKRFPGAISISAKKGKNITLIESAIAGLVYNGKVAQPESVLISNLRHIEALRRTEKLVAEAADSLDNKLSLEFIAQDIKEALGYLDVILGRRFSEDLLDRIFSQFCIGK
ncbi:MAG: tRNA uridine-5-carboxymethylaminomethyl(34) synthesis GTPase MnmE [Candidatus Omnitrophica bacterium]|nr:tRNA uridine-5-carboxymethylaminomethyl(34) synthesis GTPase MnmE [Candidatus Omnitrophota bacterium]MDD5593058.1 tRNA uridine-5-carboxymethylaminomethyl(34) synthesis GTPase MnmE [Candidatus Omnitrophota bacterium]